MKTIPLAISKREELLQQVMRLRKVYHIHCFVGTYNPKLLGIPFIPISKVFENDPKDIDEILMFEPIQSKHLDYSAIYAYLEEQFQYVSIVKLKSVLPNAIDQLATLYTLTMEQKTGLFIHIACMIENCLQGKKMSINQELARINDIYSEDYQEIIKILKPIEKVFKIIIDDYQIAIIIMIVNKL